MPTRPMANAIQKEASNYRPAHIMNLADLELLSPGSKSKREFAGESCKMTSLNKL